MCGGPSVARVVKSQVVAQGIPRRQRVVQRGRVADTMHIGKEKLAMIVMDGQNG